MTFREPGVAPGLQRPNVWTAIENHEEWIVSGINAIARTCRLSSSVNPCSKNDAHRIVAITGNAIESVMLGEYDVLLSNYQGNPQKKELERRIIAIETCIFNTLDERGPAPFITLELSIDGCVVSISMRDNILYVLCGTTGETYSVPCPDIRHLKWALAGKIRARPGDYSEELHKLATVIMTESLFERHEAMRESRGKTTLPETVGCEILPSELWNKIACQADIVDRLSLGRTSRGLAALTVELNEYARLASTIAQMSRWSVIGDQVLLRILNLTNARLLELSERLLRILKETYGRERFSACRAIMQALPKIDCAVQARLLFLLVPQCGGYISADEMIRCIKTLPPQHQAEPLIELIQTLPLLPENEGQALFDELDAAANELAPEYSDAPKKALDAVMLC